MQDSNTNVTTNLKPANKTRFILIGTIFIIVLALVGAFFLGRQSKKSDNTTKDTTKKSTALVADQLEENRNYWSIVGTVEAVTDKTITVKNNKDKIETATFTDSVVITKKGAGGSNREAIQVGAKVIVIGKDADDKITASQVIIQ